MSDLIDRQAAIEAVRTMQTYKLAEGDDMLLIDKAEVQTELMCLPSAQPQWTPCSERLPELTEHTHCIEHDIYKNDDTVVRDEYASSAVLCTMANGKIEIGSIVHFIDTSESGEVLCDEYDYDDLIHKFISIDNVLAWMPLPEPYREESEEKE